MNSDMVKRKKYGHLHLVYDFTVPLSHFGVTIVLKCILSYKYQIKKSISHIKKCANILLLKCNHL